MMKKSGNISKTKLLNQAQEYEIHLGKQSINGQRNTQTKLERQVALLEMKQSKSQYAITQSAKEEDPDVFYKDDQKKDYNPIHPQIEETATSIKNLVIENVRDYQKYEQSLKQKKKLQKTSLTQCQTSNLRKQRHPQPYKWFQHYLEIPQNYVEQQPNQSQFQRNLKCRQDYKGVVKNQFETFYHILFLKKCKLGQHLHKLFKQQVQKGYFCTKKTGQDGLKILRETKEVLYQIRICQEHRLIGSLMEFKEEKVNLIVFERSANKASVQRVINDLDGKKRIQDLKKSIYESIKLGDYHKQ